MDLERDVFPFLRDHDLNIAPPSQDSQNQNQPTSPPRPDHWMIDSNQLLPPEWRERFPESHPLGQWSEHEHPGHGQPDLATIDPTENGNGDGFLLPSDEELGTEWLQEQTEESGIEALAWYRPYHLNQGRWGITITDRGIWYIAQYLVKEMYSEPYTAEQIQECFDIATEFFLALD